MVKINEESFDEIINEIESFSDEEIYDILFQYLNEIDYIKEKELSDEKKIKNKVFTYFKITSLEEISDVLIEFLQNEYHFKNLTLMLEILDFDPQEFIIKIED